MAVSVQQKPRGCSTLCLPIDQSLYQRAVESPELFRQTLDRLYRDMPELFPEAFAHGYTLKDIRVSAKLGVRLRRIECKATGRATCWIE
jgi:hypothetical protein